MILTVAKDITIFHNKVEYQGPYSPTILSKLNTDFVTLKAQYLRRFMQYINVINIINIHFITTSKAAFVVASIKLCIH